jgi:hypothetical protein
MVRLSDGHPAGCVAEEILAVTLINEAVHGSNSEPSSGRSRYVKVLPQPGEDDAADRLNSYPSRAERQPL